MAGEPLEILYVQLEGRLDKLDAALNRAVNNGKRASGQIESGFQGAFNRIDAMAGKIGALFTGGAIAAGLAGLYDKLSQFAGQADRADKTAATFQTTLERFNLRVAESNRVVQEISDKFGVLPDKVQSAATTLIRNGADIETVQKTLTAAGASMAAQGGNIETAFENVSVAVATGRSELLESSGIITNASDAFKTYAGSVGKSTEELSQSEKVTALANAIYKESRFEIEAVDGVMGGYTRTVNEQRKAQQNLENTLGKLVLPIIDAVTKATTDLMNRTTDFIKNNTTLYASLQAAGRGFEGLFNVIVGGVKVFGSVGEALLVLTGGAFGTLITVLETVGQGIGRAFGRIGEAFDKFTNGDFSGAADALSKFDDEIGATFNNINANVAGSVDYINDQFGRIGNTTAQGLDQINKGIDQLGQIDDVFKKNIAAGNNFGKTWEQTAQSTRTAGKAAKDASDDTTGLTKEQQRAAERTREFKDRLEDLIAAFRDSVKDGKVSQNELDGFSRSLQRLMRDAGQAGVVLPRSLLAQADALKVVADQLIKQAITAEQAKKRIDEIKRANEEYRRGIDKTISSLSHMSDAELTQTAINARLRRDRELMVAVIEEVTRREEAYNKVLADRSAAEAATVMQRRYADTVGYTIAAIERTEGPFTSFEDGLAKIIKAGAFTSDVLKRLRERFPEVSDATVNYKNTLIQASKTTEGLTEDVSDLSDELGRSVQAFAEVIGQINALNATGVGDGIDTDALLKKIDEIATVVQTADAQALAGYEQFLEGILKIKDLPEPVRTAANALLGVVRSFAQQLDAATRPTGEGTGLLGTDGTGVLGPDADEFTANLDEIKGTIDRLAANIPETAADLETGIDELSSILSLKNLPNDVKTSANAVLKLYKLLLEQVEATGKDTVEYAPALLPGVRESGAGAGLGSLEALEEQLTSLNASFAAGEISASDYLNQLAELRTQAENLAGVFDAESDGAKHLEKTLAALNDAAADGADALAAEEDYLNRTAEATGDLNASNADYLALLGKQGEARLRSRETAEALAKAEEELGKILGTTTPYQDQIKGLEALKTKYPEITEQIDRLIQKLRALEAEQSQQKNQQELAQQVTDYASALANAANGLEKLAKGSEDAYSSIVKVAAGIGEVIRLAANIPGLGQVVQTVGTVIGALANTISASVVGANAEISESLKKTLDELEDFASTYGGKIEELRQKGQQAAKDAGDFWLNLFNKQWANTQRENAERISELLEIAQNLASGIPNAVASGLFDALESGDLDAAREKMREDLFRTVVQNILETATAAALATGVVGDKIAILAEAVQEALKTGDWSGVGDIVRELGAGVQEAFDQLSKNLLPELGGLIPRASGPAEGSIDALEERLKKLRDQFGAATTDAERDALREQIKRLEEQITILQGGAANLPQTPTGITGISIPTVPLNVVATPEWVSSMNSTSERFRASVESFSLSVQTFAGLVRGPGIDPLAVQLRGLT
jgi:chromosome segregation ATPase